MLTMRCRAAARSRLRDLVTFSIESRPSDSPLVHSVWRARSERSGRFISTASEYWEMVLTSRRDVTFMTVRGPQTWARELQYSADLEWFGIRFRLGTLMPVLPPGVLSDGRDANLPPATGSSFWLHNAAWQFPNFGNADDFVRRLERAGLLIYDPVVQAARHGHVHEWSVRSVQYHFAHATGLTHSMIRQIERARTAAALMERGTPVLDAVHDLGYFDQPHMTRSLKRFLGRTPAQIARGG